MSTKASPVTENEALSKKGSTIEYDALSKKAEEMEKEVAALAAAVRGARTIRLLLFLAALGFIAVAVWMFYDMGKKFTSPKNIDVLSEKAKERLNNNSDQYLRHVRLLAEKCGPVISNAVFSQLKADLPKYSAAVGAEREKFAKDFEAKLTEQITKHYQKSGERFKAIVQQEFPETNNPEAIARLSENMDAIMATLVKKYYAEELRREIDELYNTWDRFPAAKPPRKGEVTLEDELIGNLLELVELRLKGAESPDGTAGKVSAPITSPAIQKAQPVKKDSDVKQEPAAAKAPAAKKAPVAEKGAAVKKDSAEKKPAAVKN